MRHTVALTSAFAALMLTTMAANAQHPRTIYCLVSGGDAGARNCSYATVEQCNAARSGGVGGTCVAYTIQQ